jgi:dihydrofolate synthase/folylpolyglutamate synthase
VRERISFGSEPLSEEAFAEAFEHLFPYLGMVESQLEEKLTYFEVLTGLFYLWAAEAPVDAAVVEVGMGGRWDATNVAPSSVQVLTNIALDHTELLGEDRITIAREKAGIIKQGSSVVTGERLPDVLAVFEEASAEVGATLTVLGKDLELKENSVAIGGRYLTIETSGGQVHEGLFLPLHGSHQGVNAALALEAVAKFLPSNPLEEDVVTEGFAQVTGAGRLEMVRQGTDALPPVVIDVAHNPDGMSALVSGLIEGFAFDTVHVVFGALADKDYPGMLTELTRLPCKLFACAPDSPRATPAAEIAEAAERVGLEAKTLDNVAAAVAAANADAGPADLVCVTGSHYVAGEARDLLINAGSRSDRSRR